MICGVGIDICSIQRMERACAESRFVARVFTEEEAFYARGKALPAAHFAAAFAAKEAFAKAGGWGLARVGFRDAFLLRRENGAPVLGMSERARELLASLDADRTWVSISHEGDIAVAVVILEGKER